MRLALILSDFAERMQGLQQNLNGDFSVIVGRSIQESIDLLQTLPVDLALVDLDSEGARGEDLPERVRENRPHCAVVAVLPAGGGGAEAGIPYDAALRVDSSPYEITAALARVMERQRLQEEIAQQREEIRRLQARSERLQAARSPVQPVDKIIKAFSRALSSGFEQERLLNLFVDTVLEMMRVSKVSVLLHAREPGEFRVRCYRGLRPDVAQGIRLRTDSGLAAWMAREGGIMTRELAEAPGIATDVRKEMDALQARVSIPMLCSGMLVGILNLNSRVTGSAFTEDEMETLFTLAGHVAVAVRDTGIIRQMQQQKVFIEQILTHMNSGVITIDDRDRVTTFNPRAGEILGRAPEDVLHRDLRRLPSPLGDILYEARTTGKRYQDEEVSILSARIPILVNAYRLETPDGKVLGSVAIIEDLQRRKEQEKRQEEETRRQTMRLLLEQVASDIKAPVDRLNAAYDRLMRENEGTFRDGMHGDLAQLRRLTEDFSALAGDAPYHRTPCALPTVIQQALQQVQDAGIAADAVLLKNKVADATMVNADAGYLTRAFAVLIRHAVSIIEGKGPVTLTLQPTARENHASAEISILMPKLKDEAALRQLLQPLTAPDRVAAGRMDLSLPVSRRILEDHGGVLALNELDAYQRCLTVRLPILNTPESEDSRPAAATKAEA
ncbi:MAG TPA: GAF domain-containing protein [Armatimonadota bacterium]|nr:GAF domain-containing protein [Armatimonadota bacterium]